MTDTTIQTYRYRAMGFTEDITECDICGKVDLKGTVRMLIVDDDGDEDGEIHAGVICAARKAGRKASEIRNEARAADAAVRGAWSNYQDARFSAEFAAADKVLARLGLVRSLDTWDAWAKDPELIATMAAWDAAHPAPERPQGW
jgi:hypothetical protein